MAGQVFTCTTASLFMLGQRTKDVAIRVLGEQLANCLMSDGYWAYRHHDWCLRCLATCFHDRYNPFKSS
jgi:transposase